MVFHFNLVHRPPCPAFVAGGTKKSTSSNKKTGNEACSFLGPLCHMLVLCAGKSCNLGSGDDWDGGEKGGGRLYYLVCLGPHHD